MGEDFYRKVKRSLKEAVRELLPAPLFEPDSEEEVTTYPCSLRKGEVAPRVGEHLFLFRMSSDSRIAVLRKNLPIGEVQREAAGDLLGIMPPGGIIDVHVVSVFAETTDFEVATLPVREPVQE